MIESMQLELIQKEINEENRLRECTISFSKQHLLNDLVHNTITKNVSSFLTIYISIIIGSKI